MELAVKCGLITLDTIAFYLASTPPAQPPSKDEQIVLGTIEYIQTIMHSIKAPVLLKWTYTLCSVAELAAIVASEYPGLPYSQETTRLLSFPNAHLESMRLTGTFMAGSLLVTLGSLTRVWCFRHMGRHFTFELGLLKDHKLVTSGPYGIVRHPSYIGGMTLFLATILARGSAGSWIRESGFINTTAGKVLTTAWLSLVFGSIPIVFARVKTEDQFLRDKFGDQWVAWADKVKYRLIPWVY